jgi:imidazole glycerol-phosphate synthase subunit HisF
MARAGGTAVSVVSTGTSNLASMLAALGRVGATPTVIHGARGRLGAHDAADESGGRQVGESGEVGEVGEGDGAGGSEAARALLEAPLVVVPGVGAFAAARQSLVEAGLWGALGERLRAGAPTMLVCLGLQLLADGSDESPGAEGLGLVPGTIRKFPGGVRVPQLGWNLVEASPECRFLESGHAYFANSYHLPEAPAGWQAARSRHGVPFVAAMERGEILACQFHPELSGDWGMSLLARWVERRDRRAGPGPTSRIIPCLDVRDGRVVKGVRFMDLRDAGSPAERASIYEQQGADELVVLDVSATDEGRKTQTVHRVRERLGIPLTVGGGVRGPDDASRLLGAGADKVAINTAAVADPTRIDAMADRFGRQCVVVAIDAARVIAGPTGPGSAGAAAAGASAWEVVTHAGKRRTGIDAVAWARDAVARGAGEVLLTSFDQDGTREGYDTALLRAVSSAVPVPVIASGGAATVAHLVAALEAGADAVLAASIFHDGDTTVAEVKASLARAGIKVRR